MRLLMNVMNPIEAFYMVMEYFTMTDDLSSPDICKLMLWTIESISRTQISQDMLSKFIDGLKKQVSNVFKSGDLTLKHRLEYICDRLSLKTGNHFSEIVHQIMKTKQKSKEFHAYPNCPSPSCESLNRYSKIQPILGRPRSANQIRNGFRF